MKNNNKRNTSKEKQRDNIHFPYKKTRKDTLKLKKRVSVSEDRQ